MVDKLEKDGFIGPLDLNADSAISDLTTELDAKTGGFKNLHVESTCCKLVFSSDSLLQEVANVFGTELLMWRSNCFKKVGGSPEIQWHHDRHFESGSSLLNFSNLNNHFSILIALSDLDEDTGLMEFIPGSHLPSNDLIRDNRPYHKKDLTEHFITIPDSMIEKRISLPLRKGQFLLFHSALLHRSLSAKPGASKRYSLVGRLCQPETLVPQELAEAHEVLSYPFVS